MISAQQQATLNGAGCQIAFDNLTRQLYATDASIYQIEPVAVAFPKSARQASAIIQAAAQAGVPVTPRGAGTGLVGGAIGEGLVIDFSRHNRQITDFNADKLTVRAGAGRAARWAGGDHLIPPAITGRSRTSTRTNLPCAWARAWCSMN